MVRSQMTAKNLSVPACIYAIYLKIVCSLNYLYFFELKLLSLTIKSKLMKVFTLLVFVTIFGAKNVAKRILVLLLSNT